MKAVIPVSVAFILCSIQVYAGKEPFRHEKSYALPSGKNVLVVFRERSCNPGECGDADSGVWGVDGGRPRFVTEDFRIQVDGKPFVIPQKFYRDLTNTYFLNVSEQNGKAVVELRGGEAAGAYTAHFVLGGMCGFERKVCGEVCNEIWETTKWYNSFAYDFDPGCKSGIE